MINLYQGDCLEIMPTLEDNSIDCILCDLPYGTTACSWDIVIPFDELWKQYNRIIKDTGIIILFGCQPFTTELISSNKEDFRYEYIWIKNNCSNFQLAHKQPLKYHENICVFYKNLIQTTFVDIMKEEMQKNNLTQKDLQKLFPSKNGNMTGWIHNKLKGTQIPTHKQWKALCEVFGIKDNYEELLTKLKKHTYNTNTLETYKALSNKNKAGNLNHLSTNSNAYIQTEKDFPKSILFFNKETNPLHPTQKPLELIEWLIKTYTNEGDLVLDNCMGSGTTGVACKVLNRNFIGIEKEEKYFNIAEDRINKNISKSEYYQKEKEYNNKLF